MLNMSKITRNKLLWFIVAIVCIVIIYDYQKSKAAEDYQKMLEVSAKNCDLDTLKLLIKSRGDSSVSERALYYAAEKGCLEVVKFLLDEGVDINTMSLALLDAADGGQLEVVKLLLERGANPHVGDWKGRTAKTIAIRSSYHESNKPYREIADLLDKAEKSYKAEK